VELNVLQVVTLSSQRAPKQVFSEFYNCLNEWLEINVLDEKELDEIKQQFSDLQKEIERLKNVQPKCFVNSRSYEKDYACFCKDIDAIYEMLEDLQLRLLGVIVWPEKIVELQNSIDKLSAYVENNSWVYDNAYFSDTVEKLISIKEEFTPEKVQLASGLLPMQKTLEEYDALLEQLSQPTHNWVLDESKSKYCDKCYTHQKGH
jgi:DNA repair exonuclease SbcCD ATPase subunit